MFLEKDPAWALLLHKGKGLTQDIENGKVATNMTAAVQCDTVTKGNEVILQPDSAFNELEK